MAILNMSDLKITCTSIDCPERRGGECNATVDPNLMVDLFLEESNKIEGVTDSRSHKQARRAWDYLIEEEKLDGGVILKTHKILMINQPGLYGYQKGYWRREGVYIGGREGSPWQNVPLLIAHWLEGVKATVTYSRLKDAPGFPGMTQKQTVEDQIKYQHVAYERIHPFIDGNGRTGRLFMNWCRVKVGLPILIIFEDDKQEYYKWF